MENKFFTGAHITGFINLIFLAFGSLAHLDEENFFWSIPVLLLLLHIIILAVGWYRVRENDEKEKRAQIKDMRDKAIAIEEKQKRALQEQKKETDKLKERLEGLQDEYNELENECGELQEDIEKLRTKLEKTQKAKDAYKKIIESKSNIETYPWMASVMADVMTYDLHIMELQLSWGDSIERKKKVCSLIELRKETAEQLESAKMAQYQLSYLLELYPSLQDVLDAEYEDVKFDLSKKDYAEQDPVRRYLSNEEWKKLSTSERNQRALDNYIERRKKSKWQIGRDYELSIAFRYEKKGYFVERFGSEKGVEDLGRDLIAKKKGKTLLIQCKYWSKEKVIHEKHICQLFGTMMEYCFANNCSTDSVAGVFITSTELSDMAKKFAEHLHIEYRENVAFEEFPRIKCNIGKDENGQAVKIYHLPMDLNYDKTKIEKKGEMWAYTVAEAEENGFRRAYKWHGDQCSLFL